MHARVCSIQSHVVANRTVKVEPLTSVNSYTSWTADNISMINIPVLRLRLRIVPSKSIEKEEIIIHKIPVFQISKEKRKAVQTVQSLPPLKGESESLGRYKITFLPGTEWANQTIEVSIDNEKGIVEEVTDTCQGSPESSGYTLHIAISNVIKR